ncbi:MAG: DUF3467 domain-containing protein [Saprospiraceae bacterium]|nr:DUF3467 domain-containing protein [Saprospiraceae bacterium]
MSEIQENQINIELSEEVAEGTYSNLAIISHSHSEFIVDFIRLVPNVPKAKVKSRIILTPQHAKRLMKALMDNVKRYENQYGNIEDPDAGMMPPMNFPTAGMALCLVLSIVYKLYFNNLSAFFDN